MSAARGWPWLLGGGAALLLIAAQVSPAQASPAPPAPAPPAPPSPPPRGPHPPLPGVIHRGSRFGWRTDPITHERAFHRGLDLPVPTGTAVYAPYAGRVIRVDRDGEGKGEINGNAVHLAIGAWRWAFLHLSSVAVRPVQDLTWGQLLGRSGSTGRSTGPHLHLQVTGPDGALVDPETLFPPDTFR